MVDPCVKRNKEAVEAHGSNGGSPSPLTDALVGVREAGGMDLCLANSSDIFPDSRPWCGRLSRVRRTALEYMIVSSQVETVGAKG